MMRASDLDGFTRALAGWQFPSLNLVFGDRKGNIGYWLLAAIPVRSRLDARSPMVEVRVPASDGKSIAALKAAGTVLEQRVDDEDLVLRLRLLDGALGALQSSLGRRASFEILEPASEPYLRSG